MQIYIYTVERLDMATFLHVLLLCISHGALIVQTMTFGQTHRRLHW